MKQDIDCLKNLSFAQLQQLRGFVESLGYRKATDRASEEFNQPIHKSAVQRFIRRAAPAEFIEDTPENDEATRQILKFAADGQPDFTATTLRALEQLAFQLAFTCTAVDDDMNALAKITTMLCRFRNAAVRERMASVQEGKLKLRQQQFEKASDHDTDAKIEELNQKIAEAFDSHPVLTAIRNAEESTAPSEPDPNRNLNPNPSAALNPQSEIRTSIREANVSEGVLTGGGVGNAHLQSTRVPPKSKKTKYSSGLCVPSVRLSASSALSAVKSSFPSFTSVQNSHENTAQPRIKPS